MNGGMAPLNSSLLGYNLERPNTSILSQYDRCVNWSKYGKKTVINALVEKIGATYFCTLEDSKVSVSLLSRV